MAWKRKYNVSLENQTYGNEGEEENEEIVEESEVYDNEVLLEEQQQQQQQQGPSQTVEEGENPLTPTKEEAATALASLSAEDHEAAGLEIAEALQKLAKAFEMTSQGGEVAKEAMAQLTAAYQSDNPEFLLEGAGQVAVEEVVSEEVVTDEPMVVIETPDVDKSISTTTSSTTGLPPSTIITTIPSIVGAVSSSVPTELPVQAELQPVTSMAPASQTVVPSSPISTFVSEEVVISEPVTTAGDSLDNQVEVLVQGAGGVVVYTPQNEADTIIQTDVVETTTEDMMQSSVAEIALETQDIIMQPSASLLPIITDVGVDQASADIHTQVVTVPTLPVEVDTNVIQSGGLTSIAEHTADAVAAVLAAAATQDASATQEFLDLVQETIGTAAEKESSSQRIYDEDFKAKVVSRAQELGSVQQAAREFSVPWRAVATWNTQEDNSGQMQ